MASGIKNEGESILYESNVCMLFVWFSSWAAAFSELNPWLRSILCCIFYVKSSDSFFFQCLELSVFFFFFPWWASRTNICKCCQLWRKTNLYGRNCMCDFEISDYVGKITMAMLPQQCGWVGGWLHLGKRGVHRRKEEAFAMSKCFKTTLRLVNCMEAATFLN